MNIFSRTCPECGQSFHGRVDKKFCSDQCRSSYHNKTRLDNRQYIRHVNYILKKNRRILDTLRAEGNRKINPEKLRIRGFDFNYFTSMCPSEDGINYFCYEHGFVQSKNEDYLILVQKELC